MHLHTVLVVCKVIDVSYILSWFYNYGTHQKECTALLWFASGSVQQTWNMILRRFLLNMLRFLPNVPHFHGKSSAILGALQDGALSGIVSKCGTQRRISAVHGTPC